MNKLQKYSCEVDDTLGPHATFAEMVPDQAGEWINIAEIKALLPKILEEYPSGDSDSSELGRYVWPERWKRLNELIG